MKLITNVSDCRQWMIEDFLHIGDDPYCIFSPDELEEELLLQMPKKYPCIAMVVDGNNHWEEKKAIFLYQEQIEEWATLFGMKSRQ